ncbi:hypothetical protein V5799_018612 [Amblyomma americanum]|uniref:Uncharacterized protein n=1 Tax=Amblyomma americanum TaxID=6943 RepID=A0AAQ4F003_AMBAM
MPCVNNSTRVEVLILAQLQPSYRGAVTARLWRDSMANRRDVCLTVIALLIGAPWSIAEMQKKLSIVKFVDTCDPVWIYYSSVVTAPCTVNIYQYTSENWTVFTRLHIEGRYSLTFPRNCSNKTPVTEKERFIGLFGPGSPGMPSITMKVLQLQNDSSDFNLYDDRWTGPDLSGYRQPFVAYELRVKAYNPGDGDPECVTEIKEYVKEQGQFQFRPDRVYNPACKCIYNRALY